MRWSAPSAARKPGSTSTRWTTSRSRSSCSFSCRKASFRNTSIPWPRSPSSFTKRNFARPWNRPPTARACMRSSRRNRASEFTLCQRSSQATSSFKNPRFNCTITTVLHQFLERCLGQAVRAVLPDADTSMLLVRPCPDPAFGDYQTNALMALARPRKLNPRQLAGEVLARLDVSQWCDRVEIAGAGFLNFRLKTEAIARTMQSALRGEHLFFQRTAQPRTVVIDFSSPNVAKPMHVGHIRSTVLGDGLARTLRLLGHRVITDNHIGDWGTAFGKLLAGWKQQLDRAALGLDPVGEMERLYKAVNAACESNPDVLVTARQELVKLQNGDPDNLAIWREMITLSQQQFET